MRTFAPHLKITEVSNRCFRGVAQLVAFLVWDQAVAGSSPVTPTKVHQFTKLMDFSFYLIPASQKKNAIHISELRYIYFLQFPISIMLYAVRNYAGV